MKKISIEIARWLFCFNVSLLAIIEYEFDAPLLSAIIGAVIVGTMLYFAIILPSPFKNNR